MYDSWRSYKSKKICFTDCIDDCISILLFYTDVLCRSTWGRTVIYFWLFVIVQAFFSLLFHIMKKENNGFTCDGCGKDIEPAVKTSRNHCPNCFMSLHVDLEEPGDRISTCGGRMIPLEYEWTNGQIKIHFVCTSCGHLHWNKWAADDNLGDLDMRMQFRYEKYAHKMKFSRGGKKRTKS